jgi:hypothetical protein
VAEDLLDDGQDVGVLDAVVDVPAEGSVMVKAPEGE